LGDVVVGGGEDLLELILSGSANVQVLLVIPVVLE
jgi:dihydrofolate reductase